MSKLSSEKYLSSKIPINIFLRLFGLHRTGAPLVTRYTFVTNVSHPFFMGLNSNTKAAEPTIPWRPFNSETG